MSTAVTYPENKISQLDALWTLFMGQPKTVREAFAERLERTKEKWGSSVLGRGKKAMASEITPELQAKIDKGRQEHLDGETLCFDTAEAAIQWMESL